MRNIPVSKAGPCLAELFESVVDSRLPVRLTGRNSSAILVIWDDWHAIEQTLHRLSMPKRARQQPARKSIDARV
jgi:PHD/YefM family antitoxin component YafN of YafNO toxin-antitoxin module